MSSTRMYSRKQRTLPVITTMDLWQLMKLATCVPTQTKRRMNCHKKQYIMHPNVRVATDPLW